MPSVELKYYSSNLPTADVLLPGPRSHGSGHSHLSSVMGSSGPIRVPASRSGEKDVQLFTAVGRGTDDADSANVATIERVSEPSGHVSGSPKTVATEKSSQAT